MTLRKMKRCICGNPSFTRLVGQAAQLLSGENLPHKGGPPQLSQRATIMLWCQVASTEYGNKPLSGLSADYLRTIVSKEDAPLTFPFMFGKGVHSAIKSGLYMGWNAS